MLPGGDSRPPTTVGFIAPFELETGDSRTLDASPYFADPDGDDLAYAAVSSDDRVVRVSASGSNIVFDAVSPGTAQVTVTATDPAGGSAAQVTTVTAVPVVEPRVPPTGRPSGLAVVSDTRRRGTLRYDVVLTWNLGTVKVPGREDARLVWRVLAHRAGGVPGGCVGWRSGDVDGAAVKWRLDLEQDYPTL